MTRVKQHQKAKEKLNWVPSVDFKGLVEMMVDADMKNISHMIEHGILKPGE